MPLHTFLTVSGLFVMFGAALLIAAVFYGLHRRYWRPFLRHWTWSWLALAAYALCAAVARIVGVDRPLDDPVRTVLAVMSSVSGYLQIAWLLLGTVELTTGASFERRTSRRVIAGAAIFGALIAVPAVACANVAGTYLSRRHDGPRPPEPRPERATPALSKTMTWRPAAM